MGKESLDGFKPDSSVLSWVIGWIGAVCEQTGVVKNPNRVRSWGEPEAIRGYSGGRHSLEVEGTACFTGCF